MKDALLILLIFLTASAAIYVYFDKPDPKPEDTFFQDELGRLSRQIEQLSEEDKTKETEYLKTLDSLSRQKQKIRTKYDTIFISLDTLSNDSLSRFLTDYLNRYANTNWREVDTIF